VQLLRGLVKVQMFRHGEEIPNVTQFHREAFYIAQLRRGFSLSMPRRSIDTRQVSDATKDVLDVFSAWRPFSCRY